MFITKFIETFAEAANFQYDLYERYKNVKLIYCPFADSYEEIGIYIWEVQ